METIFISLGFFLTACVIHFAQICVSAITGWHEDALKQYIRDLIATYASQLIKGTRAPLSIAWELSGLILKIEPKASIRKLLYLPQRLLFTFSLYLFWRWVKHSFLQDSDAKSLFVKTTSDLHKAGGVSHTAKSLKSKLSVFQQALAEASNAAWAKTVPDDKNVQATLVQFGAAFLQELDRIKLRREPTAPELGSKDGG